MLFVAKRKRKQLSATRTRRDVPSHSWFLHLFRKGFRSLYLGFCSWIQTHRLVRVPLSQQGPHSRVPSPRTSLEMSPRSPQPLAGQPGPPHTGMRPSGQGEHDSAVCRGDEAKLLSLQLLFMSQLICNLVLNE